METPAPPPKRRIVLLSGMSGSGLSTALKAFEDLGYEAVDNLRLGLIPSLIEDSASAGRSRLRVAVDTRNASVSSSMILCASLRMRLMREKESRRQTGVSRKLGRGAAAAFHRNPPPSSACYRPACDRRYSGASVKCSGVSAIRRIMSSIRLCFRLTNCGGLIVGHCTAPTTPPWLDAVHHILFPIATACRAKPIWCSMRVFSANPHWDPKLRPLSGQGMRPLPPISASDPGLPCRFSSNG